jgi:general secretion pathway protein D
MTRLGYIAFAGLALIALAGCSAARSNFNEGRELEEEGRIEEAMYRYAEAFRIDPEVADYRLKFLAARQTAARKREKQGDELRAEARFAEAVSAYQTAAGLDASEPRYAQKAALAIQLRDAAAAAQEGAELEKGNKLREAAVAYARAQELAPKNPDYQAAAQRITNLRKSKLDGFELQLKSNQPITLRFRETRLKDVFAVISQLSGISFVYDPDLKDQSISIHLEKATFRQAVDLLSGMHKLGHKVLNESTMLLYSKNPEKVKQYEDLQLRTIHLNHLDAKQAANLVRTMLQVKRLYINEGSNALVVRDTREVADVVERIIEANDLPDAEVVLDVEVIEISDRNAKNVGLLLSNYNVQLGAFNGNNLLATSLESTSSGTSPVDDLTLNLVKAFSIRGFGGYVTVPNAQFNFGKTLANGEVLSNPKIRVKNREKAKFNVGTRVPITTATLATTGTLSQTNVQYVDVGIKVNAEPTIQLNNEVSIKLGLEVSSIISRETVGGADNATSVVTIGTRNLDTVLSLKDGETSVIGGLISRSTSDSTQKVFLLGDLPLIGPLISSNETSKDKTELILAITPRLVRGVTVLGPRLSSFSSGKEDDPSLSAPYASFEQEPEYERPADSSAPPNAALKPQTAPPAPAPQPAPAQPIRTVTPAAPGTPTLAPQMPPRPAQVPPPPLPARRPSNTFRFAPQGGQQPRPPVVVPQPQPGQVLAPEPATMDKAPTEPAVDQMPASDQP